MIYTASAIYRHLMRRVRWLFYTLFVFLPSGTVPAGATFLGRLRVSHLPLSLRMGRGCHFSDQVYLGTTKGAKIELGDAVSMNNGTHVIAYESITIGSNTAIGEYVSIRDQNHTMKEGKGPRNPDFKTAPVEIGSNCWIGRGAYIGAGSKIGDNCIVGANSVVHGTFPDNSLIVGAPARVKRQVDLEP